MSKLTDPHADQRELQATLATAIVDSYVQNPIDLAARTSEGLHVRYLPPGRVADLYHLYVASMRASHEKFAGIGVFRIAWRNHWCKALKFRRTSTHSLCATCHKLRALVLHAKTMEEHMVASASMLDHMRSQ